MKFKYRGPFGVTLETSDDVERWVVPVGESQAVSPMKSEAKLVESGREKQTGHQNGDPVCPAASTASPQAEEVPMTPSPDSTAGDLPSEVPTLSRRRRFSQHKFTLTLKPWDADSVFLVWQVNGPRGAVHLHMSSYKDQHKMTRWSGGIEFHHSTVQDDRGPDYVNCPFTGGPCWHDGTSLGASEFWEQENGKLSYENGDHRFIFDHLEYLLERRMSADTKAGQP